MGKRVSKIFRGEIISSVFYLAFGLCLILIPDQTVNIIAAGIYHIVIYAAEKEKATILDLFTGVIVMVLGVFLFFTPQIVIKILPYLLGAFVLVDSIWKIKGSYRLKKAERGRWKALFIGCKEDDSVFWNYSGCGWCGGYRISGHASYRNEKGRETSGCGRDGRDRLRQVYRK